MLLLFISGIEYLCENHLLRMDAQDIAHFLYKGEGLNKTAIGKLNKQLISHNKINRKNQIFYR